MVHCGWQINSKWETCKHRRERKQKMFLISNHPLSSDCVKSLFIYEDALGHRQSGGGCEVYLSCLEQGANAAEV